MNSNFNKLIEGSTTLFKCLLDKCLEKGKYILSEMIARRFSPPRMVALIPQVNKHMFKIDVFGE